MRAFILRRVELLTQGVGDATLVGSSQSADTLRIKPIRVQHVASPGYGTDSETNRRQDSESYNDTSQGPAWFCVEPFDQRMFFRIGAVCTMSLIAIFHQPWALLPALLR